jgi:bacillaene synthase trans-acting acyltransferase
MKKIVWMFSGQGSQYFNMGRDLFEADPVFRDWMHRCDAVVRRLQNESLLDMIYRPADGDRFGNFSDLRHTHPALFSIQYSLAQTLFGRGMKPDLLLGYSLGEMVAAAVGGALSLEAVLETVIEQARLLTANAPSGAMLAILESAQSWDPNDPLYGDTWVAARNAPQHFVLSGSTAAIERIQRHLQARDILHHRLPVTVGFHSPLIDALERPFKARIESLKLGELRYPLVSAAYADQRTQLPAGFFWEVIRRPVRFQETIAWLEARGAAVYLDLGPSGTLAAFLKYGLDPASCSSAFQLMSPFNRGADSVRRMESVLIEVSREASG